MIEIILEKDLNNEKATINKRYAYAKLNSIPGTISLMDKTLDTSIHKHFDDINKKANFYFITI